MVDESAEAPDREGAAGESELRQRHVRGIPFGWRAYDLCFPWIRPLFPSVTEGVGFVSPVGVLDVGVVNEQFPRFLSG